MIFSSSLTSDQPTNMLNTAHHDKHTADNLFSFLSKNILVTQEHNNWGHGVPETPKAEVTYAHYPNVLANGLCNISFQDVNFLEQQGCLRVPARPVLDDLMQQYFLHIHPILPLVNEGDFWNSYYNDRGYPPQERIPLLLLQAMCFASCTFISESSVAALGHPNIRSMRTTFLRRTKLLYDLGTETSPLTIAQACLLLSMTSLSSEKKRFSRSF